MLFENRCVQNRQMAKEMYGYWFFKQKPLIVCYVVLVLVFVGNFYLKTPFVSLFIPLVFAFQIFSYYRSIKMFVMRGQEVSTETITLQTEVTDDFIRCTASTGAVNTLEYNNIKKVAQTPNYILLITKAKMMLVFQKDGFTKGTKEDLLVFLRTKGFK